MGWQDLLQDENDTRVLPWTGGREICEFERIWSVQGDLPREPGWYTFRVTGGRKAFLQGAAEPPFDFEKGRKIYRGYLVGNRLIPDSAHVTTDPARLIEQTREVRLVDPGLEHFTRALAVQHGRDLIYLRQEFSLGPEGEVLSAYLERKDSVRDIPGVTPALDLAFRWVTQQKLRVEERRKELEKLRAEEARIQALEEQKQRALKDMGTGAGRRVLAVVDFETAAKAALAVTGSQLLAVRPSAIKGEMVVQYQTSNRKLECVVDAKTLQIIDAGVCLDDHKGTKGDTRFTLESLPSVIKEAIAQHKLVVWRHVPGDRDWGEDDREDWED